jgi:hypothetical protein
MRILHSLIFLVPYIVASLFAQELKGQGEWCPQPGAQYPTGKVYPFATNGEIEEYDLLKTEKERRDYTQSEFDRDWFDDLIPYSYDSFACGAFAQNVMVHFTKLEKGTMYSQSGRVLFNGYDGMDRYEIYKNQGTWQGVGNGSLPLFSLFLWGPEIQEAHARLLSFPGDDLSQESICIEEPQNDETGLQPAEGSNVMPLNLEFFRVGYPYTYTGTDGKTYWEEILFAKYTIKNGKIELLATNPYLNIIMERDTIIPKVDVYASNDEKIHYKVIEENAKKIVLEINNQQYMQLTQQEGTIDPDTMDLTNGTYKIKITATDYAKQFSSDSTIIQIYKTGINENNSLEGIITYPNPVRDYLSIILNSGSIDKVFVKIYSLDGKKCDDQIIKMQDNLGKIDLTRLKPSVYIMQVIMGNKLYTNKILKSE